MDKQVGPRPDSVLEVSLSAEPPCGFHSSSCCGAVGIRGLTVHSVKILFSPSLYPDSFHSFNPPLSRNVKKAQFNPILSRQTSSSFLSVEVQQLCDISFTYSSTRTKIQYVSLSVYTTSVYLAFCSYMPLVISPCYPLVLQYLDHGIKSKGINEVNRLERRK